MSSEAAPSTRYRLYGVAVHSGSLGAFARVGSRVTGCVCPYLSWARLAVFTHSRHTPFCLFSCVGGGHYVAYVYSEGDTKGWHYFSDSHVARRSEREVLKAEAYLLFYARVDDR